MCDYCEYQFPLPMASVDVDAFSEGVEVYVEDDRLVAEKYDGELIMRINNCPMCGEELRDGR